MAEKKDICTVDRISTVRKEDNLFLNVDGGMRQVSVGDFVGSTAGQGAGVEASQAFPRISAEVTGVRLHITNADWYIQNGYYPFVFQSSSKRNRIHMRHFTDDMPNVYTPRHKGWNVMGGRVGCFKIDDNGCLMISLLDRNFWHSREFDIASRGYSNDAIDFTPIRLAESGNVGDFVIRYGGKLHSPTNDNNLGCMRRFPFAIGFGKEYNYSLIRLTPGQLVSNLAEFSVVYNNAHYGEDFPFELQFHFSSKK